MELKETAFGYNLTTGTSATSDWGAEIGQGKEKLMDKEGISEILNGMLYYKVDNIDRITAPLGKGAREPKPLSAYAEEKSIVVASLFTKVMVNGEPLEGSKFIMFITKDERKFDQNGNENTHYGRRLLKFPDKAEFDGIPYNKLCFDAISQKLGCNSEGSWLVTDINFIGAYLAFTAIVIDAAKPYKFKDVPERHEIINNIKRLKLIENIKPSTYTGKISPSILYGPPGTGKTYTTQTDFISKFAEENRYITTFHQSFNYEDFVEGLKPILDVSSDNVKYTIEKGVFYRACERAVEIVGYSSLTECLKDTNENRTTKFNKAIEDKNIVLLCIDEINRGNVASIFGELISLIEPSKRLGAGELEMTAILPYSKRPFGVPANLFIVGTMNTADRSIQLLDSALRRRFKFEELLPNYDVIKNDDAKKVLRKINARVRSLLNKDNQIGHSYLMFANTYCDILLALYNKIIPLLEEYFYNDIAKVRFVLNDFNDSQFYVEDNDAKDAYNLFLDEAIDDEDRNFYMLNPIIIDAIESNDEAKSKELLKNLIS
jgi:hypothetical protein